MKRPKNDDVRVSPMLLAKAFGITPRHLQRLVRSGVLPASTHGKHSLVDSTLAFIRYCDRGRGKSETIAQAQFRLIEAQGDKIKMHNMRSAGELVLASDADATIIGMGQALKNAVHAMPGRYSHRLRAEPPAVSAHVVLTEAAAEILEAISTWLERVRVPELDQVAAAARAQVCADAIYDDEGSSSYNSEGVNHGRQRRISDGTRRSIPTGAARRRRAHAKAGA